MSPDLQVGQHGGQQLVQALVQQLALRKRHGGYRLPAASVTASRSSAACLPALQAPPPPAAGAVSGPLPAALSLLAKL